MTVSVIEADPNWSRELAVMTGELLSEIMELIQQPAFRFDLAEAETNLHRYLSEQTYHVFVAIDASREVQAAGFVSACESHAIYAGGAFGTIPELYVRPEYRRRGIGRSLMEALRAHSQQCGWKRLEVTTPPLPEFRDTLAFYEREGFSVTGGRKLQLGL